MASNLNADFPERIEEGKDLFSQIDGPIVTCTQECELVLAFCPHTVLPI
jgi:hypothetical protein